MIRAATGGGPGDRRPGGGRRGGRQPAVRRSECRRARQRRSRPHQVADRQHRRRCRPARAHRFHGHRGRRPAHRARLRPGTVGDDDAAGLGPVPDRRVCTTPARHRRTAPKIRHPLRAAGFATLAGRSRLDPDAVRRAPGGVRRRAGHRLGVPPPVDRRARPVGRAAAADPRVRRRHRCRAGRGVDRRRSGQPDRRTDRRRRRRHGATDHQELGRDRRRRPAGHQQPSGHRRPGQRLDLGASRAQPPGADTPRRSGSRRSTLLLRPIRGCPADRGPRPGTSDVGVDSDGGPATRIPPTRGPSR